MKTIFYIDGFNLYHALEKRQRWLNLAALAKQFVAKNDEILQIKYFSAHCPWDEQKKAKHQLLLDVYADLKIQTILGNFKRVTRYCHLSHDDCRGKYQTHEEKQTDVNIALHILNDAWLDRYEKAYIISGDTDLLPAIKMVKATFPPKHLAVIFPPNRASIEIKQVCETLKMKKSHLDLSILPNPYRTAAGRDLPSPDGWN